MFGARGCLPWYLVLECVKGVCAATYCVNADSRWVGTQMHNSTLADEEDDILNIEKLTFSR